MSDEPAPHEPPVLRVVHGGEPTADEVAALVAVLAARHRSASKAGPRAPAASLRGGWASRAAGVRQPLFPGPGAWVASSRPHR